MHISIIVAVVLVAAAAIAFELGLSSAIVEVAAGMGLGFFLDDTERLGWLRFLANLGMLGLMFMAGFEIEPKRLKQTWKASAGIGVSSFAVPAICIYALARYGFAVEPLGSALIAIALSTTSLALVFHALKERGLLEERQGQTILAAASVVDVLSMVTLALVLGEVGWGTAVFLLAAVPTLIGLPRIGAWVFRRYEGSIVELELRFVLVLLVGMGFMAESVGGIHPAVVAFAIGLVLSEVVEEHAELEEKLKGIIFSFFAPVFFLEAGMRLDFGMLTSGLIVTAVIFLVAACALKFVATALPTRLMLGTSGIFSGLLFNYRLTFGIIAASVGLKMGVLSDGLYAVVMLVVVASAALPMALLRDRPCELDR